MAEIIDLLFDDADAHHAFGFCNFWRIRDVTSPVISPDGPLKVVAIILQQQKT
ncbi:hypothetical protein PAMP_011628 [Pampus punctatissimus]